MYKKIFFVMVSYFFVKHFFKKVEGIYICNQYTEISTFHIPKNFDFNNSSGIPVIYLCAFERENTYLIKGLFNVLLSEQVFIYNKNYE